MAVGQISIRILKLATQSLRISLLNNWNNFEMKLWETFPFMEQKFYQYNLRFPRNFFILVFFFTPLVMMIGMTMLKGYVNLSVPAVGFIFAIVLCFEMFTVETGHDIEFNLMLTTIKLSYRKVQGDNLRMHALVTVYHVNKEL